MADHPGKAALAAIMEAAGRATPGPLSPLIVITCSDIASVAAYVASLEAENARLRYYGGVAPNIFHHSFRL